MQMKMLFRLYTTESNSSVYTFILVLISLEFRCYISLFLAHSTAHSTQHSAFSIRYTNKNGEEHRRIGFSRGNPDLAIANNATVRQSEHPPAATLFFAHHIC